MAVNEEEKADAAQTQMRNAELRRDLQNVYASILGDQTNKGFAAFTFEEALDAQIERIEGESTQTRPNELDRVSRIESRAVQAIEKLKTLRPEEFKDPDPDDDVNSPLEPEDA